MANEISTREAKKSKVNLWELADSVNVSESTFYRWLRKELPAEKQETILHAISEIAAARSEV